MPPIPLPVFLGSGTPNTMRTAIGLMAGQKARLLHCPTLTSSANINSHSTQGINDRNRIHPSATARPASVMSFIRRKLYNQAFLPPTHTYFMRQAAARQKKPSRFDIRTRTFSSSASTRLPNQSTRQFGDSDNGSENAIIAQGSL
jgi:hypothetical protein